MSACDEFRSAIQAAGLTPPDIVVDDGKLHRFSSNGKRGDDAGWYVYFGDGIPAGSFGCWRSSVSCSWRGQIGRELSAVEQMAIAERVERARAARKADEQARHEAARSEAASLWESGTPADPNHEYLLAKGIKPHGIRQQGGRLLVPMRIGEQLQSLQFIATDGGKLYLTGGRAVGCYHAIGKPTETICIAEGYATAATIHEATGYVVAVAFSAGNLLAVAKMLRDKFPSAAVVLCADDDYRTDGNPGITKATEAANEIGGLLAVPDFGADRPDGATDFNDLARHLGPKAVIAAVTHARTLGASQPHQAADNASATILEVPWPDPKPIESVVPPVAEFRADLLLPDSLRDWVMDEADRMPCPQDYVAAAALVGLGAVIGARCAIKPKSNDSWAVVPNLWGGIVGLPSDKKSPSIGAALKPIDMLAAEAATAHAEAMAVFETDQAIHEARVEALQADIKKEAKLKDGHPDQFAAAYRAYKQNEPQPPTVRRYKTNDSTTEKIGELLRSNPTGMLVMRDELVGLIASWDREGREADRAFFLEAWNGTNSYNTDRIGRGEIVIPNLCLSVFGGIQPDKLTEYLEQATHALGNDGMLQRFQVLVYPDRRKWEWRDRPPNARARDRVARLFEILAEFDPVTWGATTADDTCRFPYWQFAPDAQQVYIDWMHDLHTRRIPKEQREGQPIVAQHLAKYDRLLPAVALILHLAETAAGGVRGPVTLEATLRAAAWCEYLESHARRCYSLLADEGLRSAQMLADKLVRGLLENGFTAREVRRQRWRYLTTEAAVSSALEWLEDENWVRAVAVGGTGPGSGRRTIRYLINPKTQKSPIRPAANADVRTLSSATSAPRNGDFQISEAA